MTQQKKETASKINDNLSSKNKAALAAVSLAGELGWLDVTIQDIAQRSDIPLADLRNHFDNRSDVLAAYGRYVDSRLCENIAEDTGSLSQKDILFDILMDRFDILNEQRAGVISVLHSFKFDPKQALFCLPHLGRSMALVLEHANVSTDGIKGAMRIAGFTAFYLKTAYIWTSDDGVDMPKTMAALDKNLDKAAKIGDLFRL